MIQAIFSQAPVAALIFILTIITSIYTFSNPEMYGKLMLHPYSVTRGSRVYSIITSGFIHADWGHLFFNMFSFYFFAFTLEGIIGSMQFAVLYIVSLILSDLSTIMRHKDDFRYNSLGASGAISGIIFSYILFDPSTKFYIMFIPIGIPAVIFGVLYLLYSAYASKQSSGINHDAHFYGALSGLIITILFNPGVLSHFFSEIQRMVGH
ncbi:Rhomboid family protein [Arcticibacter svalbardensis MN12-7]|uniref:Rhomboid family protein n=1 Tax=Arcticibacter svalbardensis MN12-7 TaxID=1150600 RepID=R9GSM4_9SPHI|nr:rhomboid family intramembrane serine protease [Arcticibacter svalbardensis]EOR94867.1 Rhomboid family protein [Arcticibacter svalbardensis MN12-7]